MLHLIYAILFPGGFQAKINICIIVNQESCYNKKRLARLGYAGYRLPDKVPKVIREAGATTGIAENDLNACLKHLIKLLLPGLS